MAPTPRGEPSLERSAIERRRFDAACAPAARDLSGGASTAAPRRSCGPARPRLRRRRAPRGPRSAGDSRRPRSPDGDPHSRGDQSLDRAEPAGARDLAREAPRRGRAADRLALAAAQPPAAADCRRRGRRVRARRRDRGARIIDVRPARAQAAAAGPRSRGRLSATDERGALGDCGHCSHRSAVDGCASRLPAWPPEIQTATRAGEGLLAGRPSAPAALHSANDDRSRARSKRILRSARRHVLKGASPWPVDAGSIAPHGR